MTFTIDDNTITVDSGSPIPNLTDGLSNRFAVNVLPESINILDPNLNVGVQASGPGGTITLPPNPCQPRNVRTDNVDTGTTLCLNDDRFKVTVDWTTVSGAGTGSAVQVADDRGLFFYFTASSDMLVQVFDGCDINDFYWLYAAAATDAGYTLRVIDTQTNETKSFTNPLGQPAPAIVDTSAFATCP